MTTDRPLQYLATLYRDTPSAANAVAYAGIVRDRSLRRQLLAICTDLHRIAWPTHQPVSLDGAQALVMALGERSAIGGLVAIAALKPWADEIPTASSAAARSPESRGPGDLDAATSGLEAGRLYVVAGRPGMGKSVLGLHGGDRLRPAHPRCAGVQRRDADQRMPRPDRFRCRARGLTAACAPRSSREDDWPG